jgi:alkanesulfonate monooxygenase SsuD/methylene tetrahydromethanopterin reductase-like flavin-dependent oxidoreductase (luciferase family)
LRPAVAPNILLTVRARRVLAMRCHLFYLPSSLDKSDTACYRSWYEGAIQQCIRADAGGWAGAWFAEHHHHSYGGALPSPDLLLSFIAAQTVRLRLGLGVLVLPLHNAINLAERLALLDQLSRGRLDLGIGSGVFAYEFEPRGLSVDRKWNLFVESHETLILALRSGAITRRSGDDCEACYAILPPTIQKPTPPVWVAANSETVEWSARQGHNLLVNYYNKTQKEFSTLIDRFKSAAQPDGRAGSARIATIQHLYIEETDSQAPELPRSSFLRYLNDVQTAFQASEVRPDHAPPAKYRMPSPDIQYEVYCREKVSFGTTSLVIGRLEELRDLGVTDVLFMPQFADLAWELAHQTLSRFTAHVLPTATAI